MMNALTTTIAGRIRSIRFASETMTLLQRFRAARSGLAALEFALILPMLLLLYFGTIEVSNLISVRRKLDHAANTLGDLAAQSNTTVTAAAIQDLFYAGNAVMQPFDASALKAAIVGVALDSKGAGTVAWAQVSGGATCPAKGSAVAVPTSLATPNSFLIMVDASYNYVPKLQFALSGPYLLTQRIFQQPRLNKAISGASC